MLDDAAPRVLDRRPHFDDRSCAYPIRALLPERVARTRKVWDVPGSVLDQGAEGACVGFGWAGELAAAPVIANQLPGTPTINNPYALDLYYRAQAEDRIMGNNWPEGASVLAGAKAVAKLGLVSEYRWAFGIDDAIDAIIAHGPVVLGIPWTDKMYYTDARGLVSIGGNVVGGHCIVAYGYVPNDSIFGSDMIWLRNSWGPSYGINGTGYIRTTDLAELLSQDGDCCVPTDRSASPATDPDVILASKVRPWVTDPHVGPNRAAAQAVAAWLQAKKL